MRRLLLALFISLQCILTIAPAAYAQSRNTIAACQPYIPWSLSAQVLRVAVLGDSLSQGWGTTDPYSCGYVEQLPNRLPQAILSQMNISSVKEAQGGQRTDQMAPLVQQLVDTHPDISIIELGSNDVRQTTALSDFNQSYAEITQALQQSRGSLLHTPVIVCLSIWPSPGYDDSAVYAPYNQAIANLCANAGGYYVDISSLYNLHSTTDYDRTGNWHPNNQGAILIDDAIVRALLANHVFDEWCPLATSCPVNLEQPAPLISSPDSSYRHGR